MRTRAKPYKLKKNHTVWLYSVVYASKISIVAVLVLFTSLLIQPLHQAFANESATEITTDLVEVVEDNSSAEEVPVNLVPLEIEAVIVPEFNIDDEENEEEIVSDPDSQTDVDLPVLPIEDSLDLVITSTTTLLEGKETTFAATSSAENLDEDELLSSTTSAENVSDFATSSEEILPPDQTEETENLIVSTTTASTTTDSQLGYENDDGSQEDSVENSEQTSSGSGDNLDDDVLPEIVDSEIESTLNQLSDSATSSVELDEVIPETTSTDESDSTTETVEESQATSTIVTEAQSVITDDNYYQFSRQSCVPVGDGTYHCSVNTESAVDSTTVVYADRDEEGDMEIYIKTTKNTVEKITDNDFDDTSPHLDTESMRVVWQRMINGRYQVISYDLNEGKEVQLTFSRNNNMEPKVSDSGIVWQSWDGNDWEIMYFDGTYTDQITDNESQDVTPVIQDDYIIWSILGAKTQEAQVFSIDTGEILTISGYEGGAVVNPRFVLVYDTMFENGDVITQGFDPKTGLSAPIAAQPGAEPVKIPDTDSTGETRALIQNKSSQKNESSLDGVKQDDEVASGFNPSATSTATSSDTIQLKSDETLPDLSQTVTDEGTSAIATPLELTEFDLVIVSTTTASGTKLIATTSTSSTQE